MLKCFSICVAVLMIHILKLWTNKSSLPIHLLFAVGAVGQITGVIIAWLFMTSAKDSTHLIPAPGNSSCLQNVTVDNQDVHHCKIHWAFAVVGSLSCLLGLLFVILAVRFNVTIMAHLGPDTSKKLATCLQCCSWCSTDTKEAGHSKYTYILFIILFILRIAIRGKETSIQFGIMPVAIESDLHFTKDAGAMIKTFNFLARAVGRSILGVISHFISIQLYSSVCMTLQAFIMALIAFLGISHPLVFWICVPVHAVFTSVSGPAAISLFNRYIKITGIILAASDFAYALGNITALVLNGYLLDLYGARWILIEAFGWSLLMFTGFLVVIFFGYKLGDRFVTEEIKIKETDTEAEKPLLDGKH